MLEHRHGLRFGTLEQARRFAYERLLPDAPTFGFHGLFNMHRVMPPAELHALVADRLKDEVRGGALFVFTNKRHHLIKVLHLDGTGCWLMTKRWRKARSSGRVRPRRDR